MYCSDCKNTGTQTCMVCCTYQGGVPDRWEPKPATNYDRIVSKTPEELAQWLSDDCCQLGNCQHLYDDVDCSERWLDYLKQEAKE